MLAVERDLRASTVAERVWLFTNADAPQRLLHFYKTQLGFLEVFYCCKPPSWICKMWGGDHLFMKHVGCNTLAVLVKDIDSLVKDPEHKAHCYVDLLVKDPKHKVHCYPEPSPVATPANHCTLDLPHHSRARERLQTGSGAPTGQSAVWA